MEASERFIYDSSPGEKFSRSRSNDVCRLITDQPPAEEKQPLIHQRYR